MKAISIDRHDSGLCFDETGVLKVKIFQRPAGAHDYGRVKGFDESQGANDVPSAAKEEFCSSIAQAVPNGLSLYSFHPDAIHSKN